MHNRFSEIGGKECWMLLAWIKNIVLFILFSSLVFFLLPDEKYRKYMQTAVGFVLAIIVLTPVLSAGGLNDILSFDYYYESVAGAPGNGDVTYYTDVMETMIKDHLRDTFQLDSKVAITFDENYTITAVDVTVGELDTKNDVEDNVVSEKTAEKEESFDRAADTTEKESVSGIAADTIVDAAKLRQEIAKEYKISEDRIKVFINGYQTK
ncbi:putative stage III sporulation protein AF [Clostridium sp. L2-50]|jgi:stage III sporulation protein AF|nr:putative stage III sporulation protein AF [Clostridium sp. L2-50]